MHRPANQVLPHVRWRCMLIGWLETAGSAARMLQDING